MICSLSTVSSKEQIFFFKVGADFVSEIEALQIPQILLKFLLEIEILFIKDQIRCTEFKKKKKREKHLPSRLLLE